MALFKNGLQRLYSQNATTAFCFTKDKVFKAKFDQAFGECQYNVLATLKKLGNAFVNRVLATKGKV